MNNLSDPISSYYESNDYIFKSLIKSKQLKKKKRRINYRKKRKLTNTNSSTENSSQNLYNRNSNNISPNLNANFDTSPQTQQHVSFQLSSSPSSSSSSSSSSSASVSSNQNEIVTNLKFHKMMNDFIFEEANTSVFDVIMGVYSLRIKHSMSDEATNDLLKFIKMILPNNSNFPKNLRALEKSLVYDQHAKIHLVCSKCEDYSSSHS